jgi:hypothetical protein
VSRQVPRGCGEWSEGVAMRDHGSVRKWLAKSWCQCGDANHCQNLRSKSAGLSGAAKAPGAHSHMAQAAWMRAPLAVGRIRG